jgi:hypothetical protein
MYWWIRTEKLSRQAFAEPICRWNWKRCWNRLPDPSLRGEGRWQQAQHQIGNGETALMWVPQRWYRQIRWTQMINPSQHHEVYRMLMWWSESFASRFLSHYTDGSAVPVYNSRGTWWWRLLCPQRHAEHQYQKVLRRYPLSYYAP